MTPHDNFMAGARIARQLAAECLRDAKTAATARAFYLIAEADRHVERAEFYEVHAAMYAPQEQERNAA